MLARFEGQNSHLADADPKREPYPRPAQQLPTRLALLRRDSHFAGFLSLTPGPSPFSASQPPDGERVESGIVSRGLRGV
jgi:hypothetical protein